MKCLFLFSKRFSNKVKWRSISFHLLRLNIHLIFPSFFFENQVSFQWIIKTIRSLDWVWVNHHRDHPEKCLLCILLRLLLTCLHHTSQWWLISVATAVKNSVEQISSNCQYNHLFFLFLSLDVFLFVLMCFNISIQSAAALIKLLERFIPKADNYQHYT